MTGRYLLTLTIDSTPDAGDDTAINRLMLEAALKAVRELVEGRPATGTARGGSAEVTADFKGQDGESAYHFEVVVGRPPGA